MTHQVAILTGDLVRSTRAGPAATDDAIGAILDVSRTLATATGHDTRFTRFRGDGWQMLLDDPRLVLRATILILAALRSGPPHPATRIGVGLGQLDSMGTRDLSDARGTALVNAGKALDSIRQPRRIAIQPEGDATRNLDVVLNMVDALARRWSREQAEAVLLAASPENLTHADIAERFAITRQALQARLAGAGMNALAMALWSEERLPGAGTWSVADA